MQSFLKQWWRVFLPMVLVGTVTGVIASFTVPEKNAEPQPTYGDPELALLNDAQASVRAAFAAYDWSGNRDAQMKQVEAETRCYEEINKRRLARIQELTRATANAAAMKNVFEGLKALLKRPSRFEDLNEAEERLMKAFETPMSQDHTLNAGEELPTLTYARCVADIHKKRMERIEK